MSLRKVLLAILFPIFFKPLECQIVLTGNASAIMYSAQGYGERMNYVGTILVRQYTEKLQNGSYIKYVKLTGVVTAVYPGNNHHGFHVHENRAFRLTGGCSGIGSHWNPLNTKHGHPRGNSSERHVGDLGNLKSDTGGRAYIDIADHILEVGYVFINFNRSIMVYNAICRTGHPHFDIVGKSLAIHQSMDDFGIGGYDTSEVNGNSGSVITCGNIELVGLDSYLF